MLFRKIRKDKYLKKFVEECRHRFGNNLIAVVVFGSYSQGYFNRKESDYDIFVILNEGIVNPSAEKKEFMRKFPRVSFQYLLSGKEVIERAHLGHWTSYITLLTVGRVLYVRKGKYRRILRKLRKINLFEKAFDVAVIELETKNELEKLKKGKGFNAIKLAVPLIRKRLQLLSYIKSKKLIWSLEKNLSKNKEVLSGDEISFVRRLNRKMRKRSEDFSSAERKISEKIVRKLNKSVVLGLARVRV